MAASGEMIIVYISSDEDEGCSKPGGQKKKEIDDKSNIIKKDLDDDCVILDGDPDKPLGFENESLVHGSESDELVIVAEKGQVACRDYPHARHLCARFPFNTNPHEKYCALCHCYVCDTRAPCDLWDGDMSSGDHCHATDKEELWRILRQCSKQGKMAQLPALNHPVNPPSNSPTLHPTTSLYRPLSGGEARAVLVAVRSILTAFDQLTVQTSRLTGTVKWFNCRKGYGFITPDSGDEDLFVHHSSIKSVGYRRLAEGEAVEFHIEIRDDGRKMAIEVTGLGTSFVRGATTTRDSNLFDVRGCYKCGETGHLARNCVVCYNCGKTGHLARDCSCTGSETDGTDSISSDTGRYNYSSDSPKCYNCGKAGHLMRNCPNTGTESDANDNWHEAGSAFDEELNWE